MYLERKAEIVAGLAINRSGATRGVSNAFGQDADVLDCIAAVCAMFPATGLVGYGNYAEVRSLATLGFEPLGPLRVWLSQP